MRRLSGVSTGDAGRFGGGDQRSTGRIAPGTTFYVPKNAPHQFLNVGKTPYDVVVVMLK
jgi:mannose-6-phosphate isomerase-like protein (cupin superfamily)